jgi:hypothetical protein
MQSRRLFGGPARAALLCLALAGLAPAGCGDEPAACTTTPPP